MGKLKVGEVVKWEGCFGTGVPKDVVVKGIQITNGAKYGDEVNEVSWLKMYGRNVVVTLNNGHWAYASQIYKK